MTTGMVDAGEEPVRGEKGLLASLVVKLGNVLVWRNHFSKKNGEV
jgi:hypothetical protein